LLPGAWAQQAQADRPQVIPKSDVAVIYRFDGVAKNYPRKLQITYTKAGERVRIDYFRWFEAKYPYLTLIFDRPADRLISVQPERKVYFDRPIGDNHNPGALLSDDMTLTRLGTEVVAHAPCTVWKISVPGKEDDGGTACVTADGIVLRVSATKPTVKTLIATDIRYGAPPDDVFDPPKRFTREPLP
jgi:hypothetical protein